MAAAEEHGLAWCILNFIRKHLGLLEIPKQSFPYRRRSARIFTIWAGPPS